MNRNQLQAETADTCRMVYTDPIRTLTTVLMRYDLLKQATRDEMNHLEPMFAEIRKIVSGNTQTH